MTRENKRFIEKTERVNNEVDMPSTSWYWCLCCGKPFDTKDLMTCRKQITYHCRPCHKGGHKDTRPMMKKGSDLAAEGRRK